MKTSATPSARATSAAVRQLRRPGAAPQGGGAALPAPLRHGIEALSGLAMDQVRVHADSPAPARLGALAFAQGTDIHLGPGQQQHLPHEAWHVVQQLQGRVKPTLQLRAAVPANADAALEHEADVMGQRALRLPVGPAPAALHAPVTAGVAVVQRLTAELEAKYENGDTVDSMMLRNWQEDAKLSDDDMQALDKAKRLVEACEHLEAHEVPAPRKNRVAAILTVLDRLASARAQQPAPPTLRERVSAALGMSDTITNMVLSGGKASDKALGEFLDLGRPDTEAILQCVASGKNTLRGVLSLLNNHAANYTRDELLGWAGSHGDAATERALVDTAHEINPGYVAKWLSYGVTAASPSQLRQLVRFQALLATGAQLAVHQADTRYTGTEAKRTGFLRHVFADGTVMNVHTHWARADMRLVSMHVQDLVGDNGLEMNQWKWFDDVANEVMAAHNRAVGNLRPSQSVSAATGVVTYGVLTR